MKPQPKGGHGVIPTISQASKKSGSLTEDVLGRKSRLDLEMLFSGIRGVFTTGLLQRVIDLGLLLVSVLVLSMCR
jgi:hypothetical protein